MEDFDFDSQKSGLVIGSHAPIAEAAPNSSAEGSPAYASNHDEESSRRFTLTIETHSNAINGSDNRSSDPAHRLQCLRSLLDDLSRTTEADAAERILSLSQLEPTDRTDPECAAILEEIEQEVSESRHALAALAQEQITECIDCCNNVLFKKPEHQLFLSLRAKAKGADYSSQAADIARIRALLDCGPLADAQAAMKKAAARFPDASELWELDFDIREKAIRVRNLVERGDQHLEAGALEPAGSRFLEALQLLPFDTALRERILNALHLFAQTMAAQDSGASEAALAMIQRIQPGSVPPADLKAAISHAHANREVESLIAEEAAPPANGDNALEPEIVHSDILERAERARRRATPTAGPRLDVVDVRTRHIGRTARRVLAWAALACAIFFAIKLTRYSLAEPPPRKALEIPDVVAGTLSIRSNVADAKVIIDKREYDLASAAALSLNAGTYQVGATREGYFDFGPVKVDVKAGAASSLSLLLTPKPVTLRIRQADPGTKVFVDGALLDKVPADGNLASSVLPGHHTIQLARAGYTPVTFARVFAVGESTTLSGPEVILQSTDSRTVPQNRNPEPRMARQPLSDLVSTLPPRLRAGVGQPESAKSPEATVQQTRANAAAESQRAEETAWASVHQDNRSTIDGYLANYPSGTHAEEANRALASLASLELSQRESAAILAVIQRFAAAWNAKDLKSIASIEQDLDQRELKTQLAPLKSVAMKISPVMAPQIDGSHATVVCKRQANETFSDGSTRQNPESIVTYVLGKRDGVWIIEHAR